MTAEVALLNKVAVALAADSAGTIASGDKNEKVFNTEEKLFELSNTQPIGVMIYNAPNFLETPIQILIKQYRDLNRVFENIDEAAKDFRLYLRDFAKLLDKPVLSRSFERLTKEPYSLVNERFAKQIEEASKAKMESPDFNRMFEDCLDFYLNVFERAGKCLFTSEKTIKEIEKFSAKKQAEVLNETEEGHGRNIGLKFNRLIELFLKSDISSRNSMGIVIAGYAKSELFPSLRSFVVNGMVGDSLRYMNAQDYDITYGGARAKVLPFAQQDMVDRFVCGIDAKSQGAIERFCKTTLHAFSDELLAVLGVDDPDDKQALSVVVERAEEVFITAVNEEGFGRLKSAATDQIEQMIEFMPKPDLAQMAESLIELTSVKRRFSKGFDTVGGPIDVAVISRSEGFVWIKRKHYFDAQKNTRYFHRIASKDRAKPKEIGVLDGIGREAPSSRAGGRGKTSRSGGSPGRTQVADGVHVAPPQKASRGIPGGKRDKNQNDRRA